MRFCLYTGIFMLFSAVTLMGGPGIGEPAPNFTLPDTGYVYHSLSDYQYDVVLVNHGQSG